MIKCTQLLRAIEMKSDGKLIWCALAIERQTANGHPNSINSWLNQKCQEIHSPISIYATDGCRNNCRLFFFFFFSRPLYIDGINFQFIFGRFFLAGRAYVPCIPFSYSFCNFCVNWLFSSSHRIRCHWCGRSHMHRVNGVTAWAIIWHTA